MLTVLPLAAAEPPAALTPDQQRAAMHMLDGFDVSLFASEADGVVPTRVVRAKTARRAEAFIIDTHGKS